MHNGGGRAADRENAHPGTSPTLDRLEHQLAWYDDKSSASQRQYKRVKVAQLVLGAAVPVVVLVPAIHPILGASLGAVVVILEGVQQLYQWQTNWVLYRSTAEALKHEKYLFLAGAGPYVGDDRMTVLAERVEGLVSQEHAKWTEAKSERTEARTDAPVAPSTGAT